MLHGWRYTGLKNKVIEKNKIKKVVGYEREMVVDISSRRKCSI
jgi:hypothetical protein